MKMTDWLGNEIGVGDTVMYIKGEKSWRGMSLGTVLDIWQMYRDGWEYKRYEEGQELPMFRDIGRWNYEKRCRDEGELKPAQLELRVKILPHNKISSGYLYNDYKYETIDGEYVKVSKPIRPVTLQNTKPITFMSKGE